MVKTRKFFSNLVKSVFSIVGLIITVYGVIKLFIDIPPIIQDWDWHDIVILGLSIIVVDMCWIILDLQKKYVWGSKPDICIICQSKPFYVQGYTMAFLEIKNNEQMNITNCYARLLSVDEIYYDNGNERRNPIIPSLNNKKNYFLRWDEHEDSNEKREITIPRNDSKILNVAITDNLRILKLILSEIDLTPNWIGGEKILCAVHIRIDGTFNEKPMKPLIFDGFISVETKYYNFSNGTFSGKTNVYKLSFFEKEDWMKRKKEEKREKRKKRKEK